MDKDELCTLLMYWAVIGPIVGMVIGYFVRKLGSGNAD